MDAVLYAPGNELIQIPQLIFIDQAAILRVVRESEGRKTEKDSGKVEAVVREKLNVRFPKVGAEVATPVVLATAEASALPL